MRNVEWMGRHEGVLRDLARASAYGDSAGLKQSAIVLAARIPDECTLVPMPSHIGYATTMLSLCTWIVFVKGLLTDGHSKITIWNHLECDPHESSHIVKLRNGTPPKIKMYAIHKPPEGKVIIIDNTIATGATASAALEAIPNSIVLALTKG